MTKAKTILLAGTFLLLVLLPGLNHGVWRPDEPLVAGLCSQMARSGDFVVPLLNGQPFLEKPPLYFVLGAAVGKLAGVANPLAFRSVSIILASLTLLLTYLMAARVGGRRKGLLAVGILASSGLFFRSTRWIQIDIGLAWAVALCMWAYLEYLLERKRRHAIVLGLSLGLAFMFKGLIGPALVAAAILTDLLRQRSLKLLLNRQALLVILCMLIPIAPWLLALYARGGYAFVREVIVVNNFGRFLGSPEGAALGHQKGLFFYLHYFPREILPWTFLFIPALAASLKNFKNDVFLPWFLGPFLLLSLSSTKRGLYLLPLLPAVACITAAYLGQIKARGWQNVLLKITWGLALVGLLLPFAAIFYGQVYLGLGLGLLGLGLATEIRLCRKLSADTRLVCLMLVAWSLSATVFYQVLKPREDYLPVSRAIVAAVGQAPLTLVQPDEIFDALLPMLTGRNYAEVHELNITRPGLYLWTEKDTDITEQLTAVSIRPVLEKKLGSRNVRLAELRPLAPDQPETED